MRYTIEYAFDVSCYGSVDIEAFSPEEARQKAIELHKADSLMDEWNPEPEVGTSDHRIVSIEDEDGEVVDDGFSLDEDDE
jgi:hypothetical protein